VLTPKAARSLTSLCRRQAAKSFQFIFLSGNLLLSQMLSAQTPPRPRITGLSHIAIFAHEYQKSRAFYGKFLGFEEPYSLQNPDGTASMTFFKIDDRQVIELFPERQAGTDRLNHISLETDDIEALRVYLTSKASISPFRSANY
jgi:hypothetical protein